MRKFILCILLVFCVLSTKGSAEEFTWGSCTTYAPMPVLFIHGINANSLTWGTATKELEKYFGYRWRQFGKEYEWITPTPPGHPVTYDEKNPNAPQNKVVKHYLEAFDYGGEDKVGSFNPLDSHDVNLNKEVEEVLKAYYGDDWEKKGGKVIIVAHSQGGLISRHYIQYDGGKKVKRLITIGTPHLGSGWANVDRLIAKDMTRLPLIGWVWKKAVRELGGEIIGRGVGLWHIKYVDEGAIDDMCRGSNFLEELNKNANLEKGVEHVALVGKAGLLGFYLPGDGIVSVNSQEAYDGQKYIIPWDDIIKIDGVTHFGETKKWEAFRQALDGIPDKGTKTYDTPRVTLGTSTFTPGTPSLYCKVPANDFYITGKIYDYLPGSCTVTVELDSPNNYATDKDGQIKDRLLIKPIDMNTESQEVATNTTTPTRLNAKFNFHPLNSLSAGTHTFRLTVRNPGSSTGTATTLAGKDWIPFEITSYIVEAPVQMTASPPTPVPAGIQASSCLYFWDNQNNYWERWINSNLRVDADNIIRYNAGTSNLNNPNLRHRVYLESRIYPAGSNQPKASAVNKKEMQAITYTFASQPFKLLPFTKEDNTVVYRPDVNEDGTITYPTDMVTFINNEVVFTPKKDAYPNLNFQPIVPGNPMYTYPVAINIPPTYQGVSSNLLDTYINQVGALSSLESVQKGYDYAKSLSSKPEFNPTINIAYVQNTDLTPDSITCFGTNSQGIYRLLVNSQRQDEYNEDKILQAYANALLVHYKSNETPDAKITIASITYTMGPGSAFVDGFCMRFSAAVRGTSIVELPVKQKGVTFDLSKSTHCGTTSALAIAQALYRVPMTKIWSALETPIIHHHSDYTVIDLLNELDAQSYNTKPIRDEFFSTISPPPTKPELGTASVSPETGTAGTTFTFRVRYQDESGYEPMHISLRIEGTELRRVNQDEYNWIWDVKPEYTKEIKGSPFKLALVDGTITTGAIYEAKVRLTKADTYIYWFEVIDGLGVSLTTDKYPFSVIPAGINRLNVTPNSAILVINSEVEFEVKGYDEFGNELRISNCEFRIVNGAGTLSNTLGSRTTFIAGNTPGTATIICESLIPPLSSLIPLEIVSQGPVYIKGGEVSGRWTKGGSPYIITDNIYIPQGKTLRIDPGVTVKFHFYIAKWNDDFLDWIIPPEIVRRNLTVQGSLLAEGTVDEPIIFTPISDGGTWTPCFGDWEKIEFQPGSMARLKYCQIKYAGYADWWLNDIISIEPAVLIKSKDIQMSNCLVTDKGGCARRSSKQQGIGILIDGVQGSGFEVQGSEFGVRDSVIENCWGGLVVKNSSGVQFNNNTVKDDGSYGMQVVNSSRIAFLTNTVTGCSDAAFSQDLASSEIEYRGNNAAGNDFDLIWLVGNCPEGKEVTLKKASLPYGFNSLKIPQGTTLKIEPGVKFTLTRLGHINEDIRNIGWLIVEGRLIAEGTPEEEIVFAQGGFGNWNYIKFIGPNASASSLKYCKIIGGGRRDGSSALGESSVVTGALWLINSIPKIEYCQIMDTKLYEQAGNETFGGYWDCGIRLENLPAGYVLANNTFSNCTKGVAVYNCPNPSLIASNTLTNNTYCFYQEPNSFPEYQGNTFKDNEYTVILTGRAPREYKQTAGSIWVFTDCEITIPKAVWKEAGLPYAIDEYLRVNQGSTLMIEPGVIIKLVHKNIPVGGIIDVQGELIAEGSPQAKIVFTSINDGDNHIPQIADWCSLSFGEGSRGTLTDCVVKYGGGIRIDKGNVSISDCLITQNGDYGIYINNASPTISKTTVSSNRVHGIVCDNYSSPVIRNGTISYNGSNPKDHFGILCRGYSNAIIVDNVFTGNAGCPLGQDVNTFPIYKGNKMYGNKYDAVGIVWGNEMNVSGTWTNLGTQTTYILFVSNTDMRVKSGVTLEIEPGVIIQPYIDNYWAYGGMAIEGKLLACGTEERPIVFTPLLVNYPGPYWGGIKFFNGGEGIMEHSVVRYGGSPACISIDSASKINIRNCYISNGFEHGISLKGDKTEVKISDSIITSNGYAGIMIDNASPIISNTTVSYNGSATTPYNLSLRHGIICQNYAYPIIQNGTISYNGIDKDHHGICSRNYSNPIISNNVISGNYGCGLGQDLSSFPVYDSNKMYKNGYDAVGITGDREMKISGTWTNISTQTTYILSGSNKNIVIGVSVTLEIEPGVVIKPYTENNQWWSPAGFSVRGKLIAKGTKDRPIAFTSFFDDEYGGDTNKDSKGLEETNPTNRYWGGIRFEDGGKGIMEYCVVRYGGGYGNIHIQSSAPIIRNCLITKGGGAGILLTGETYDKPIIEHNIITNNEGGIRGSDVYYGYYSIPFRYVDIQCRDNYIYGNSEWGFSYPMTVTVTHNWWGHPSGPNHKNNPNGKGDKINGDKVIYAPWLGKDFVITPNSGTVGSLVSICGSGLEPSISLTILFGITGTVSFTPTNSYGSFSGSFTIPEEKEGKKEIAFLYPQIGKGITGKMVLSYFTLLSEGAAYLTITPGFITIGCGGSYDFEVQGYDKWGNPLPNLAYQWQITHSLASISPTTGYWTILKAGTTPITGTLSATCGSLSTQATIILSATPPKYPLTGTIVYLQGEKNKGEIWIMKGDGSQRQKLNIQQTKAPYYPKLSKDGQSLVYGAGREEWVGYEYCHNLMTGSERLLSGLEPWLAKGWDWNTKGDRIYLHYEYYNFYYNGPWVFYASADGKEFKVLKTSNYFPAVNAQENLLVTRSGKAIVVYDLIRLKNDTWIENGRNIPCEAKDDTEARFSPDDRRIGYIDNVGENLWLTNIDGKIKRRVTNNGSVTCFSFSPDGKQMIFSRQGDLWMINIDGTGERKITDTPNIDERQVDWVGGLAPIFTPNLPQPAPMLIPTQGFAEDLTGAFVYPNPTDGKKLIFAGLTRNVRIRVFTVVGEEVFDTEVAEPNKPDNGKWIWDCRGLEGQRLASGIYIYLLTNDQRQKKTGKLGIVR